MWIGRKNFIRGLKGAKELYDVFAGSLQVVVPISATIYFAYATSEAFIGMGMDDAVRDLLVAMNVPLWLLILLVPLLFAVVGMIVPGWGRADPAGSIAARHDRCTGRYDSTISDEALRRYRDCEIRL